MAKFGGASVNWTHLLLSFLLLASIGMSQQASVSGNFYTAGVVEFRQAIGEDDNANVADNLAGYLAIIESSNATATDIIVFPEATLNSLNTLSFVPTPEEQVTPCLSDPNATYYASFLVALSCAARTARKYIVINISERQLCSVTPEDTRPCAPSGHNIFNTNVVFDRSGMVVSRYRKVHLYGEPRNSTFVPEVVSFETDFNVTFGHFICFDILFYVPAHQLIVEQGITDFLYPSMWFSQLPFLTAVQVQMGWAYSNDVNLLAAGASRPEWVGSTGTGIYHGKQGSIVSVMNAGEGERRLYVAQVPKYEKSQPKRRERRALSEAAIPRRIDSSNFTMKEDDLKLYETQLLNVYEANSEGSYYANLCHKKFCCHFEIEWQPSKDGLLKGRPYSYRVAAYDGWRSEAKVDDNYLRNCGIFACNGPELSDCGQLLNGSRPQLNFNRLLIEVVYPKSKEFLLIPDSVRENLLPLEPSQFEFTISELENGNQVKARYELAKSMELTDLLTFGIYGNYYDEYCTYGTGTEEQDLKCGHKPTGDGAAQLHVFLGSWLLLAVTLAFHLTS